MKNLEFKASISNLKEYEEKLLTLHPKFLGTELQTDTYFNATNGRLKLRESNLKNILINYYREESSGTKIAEVMLYQHDPNIMLKEILTEQLGVKVIVNKKRKKYSIKNAVFHFDIVADLGTFLEVEVTETEELFSLEKMQIEIDQYLQFFELKKDQLISASYSELLMDIEK
ncbi:CYTH domain-containing protein [Flavobacterium sp. 102]|uniref:CYTH domain-containing protein n=1 Tax=Flavobacterium sp. 102 TaxID=2135623 RepID=UPI000EAD5A7B|nr:CYTH domain-containing protein [Flavobacterium sp. 102]RKS03140.1 putative adenylyl cyclase CyaB [Flavobacterium sp. 102]